jgi:PPOX class probable F420-dependent enzyme
MDLSPDSEALVQDARIGHLATVDTQHRPHLVPVCFVYADGLAYIVLDAKPKSVPVLQLQRVNNLLHNPEVQLLVDRYDEDWRRLAYVQLRGLASLIECGDEHAHAVQLLRTKYPQYTEMPLETAPIIRIEVYRAVPWQA